MFPGRRTRPVMAVKSTVRSNRSKKKKGVSHLVTGLIKKADGASLSGDAPGPCAKGLGLWQAKRFDMCEIGEKGSLSIVLYKYTYGCHRVSCQ